MKLALIGVGQAGGKVLEKFVKYDEQHNTGIVVDALAVNSAESDMRGLKIPEEKKILIGKSTVKGRGVGTDNTLGSQIMNEDIQEVQASIDKMAVHEVDAFLIIAGLGGGTGSGGSPVLAKHLTSRYEEPIYGLGILPSENEGGVYSLNASRSFQTFVNEVDNLLTFDNNGWKQSGESLSDSYNQINNEIMKRFGTLFSAGEIQAIRGDVAESVVDASEIINTFKAGGLTSIGHAEEEVATENSGGILNRFRGGNSKDNKDNRGSNVNRISSLTRNATLGRLTLECNIESTQRALLLVSGPPEYLSRKGIENSRKWLENETNCMEVRGGDYPVPNANTVSVTVVLSGVTDAQRVRDMQKLAVETQENIEKIKEEGDDKLDELVNNEDTDEIDSIL